MAEASPNLTGGCQCGAVRYRLDAAPNGATICHCRMCQKAGGGPFMAFAGVPAPAFILTRGEVTWWKSSEIADRGFCRDCGTPLTYRGASSGRVGITLGSLDDPEAVPPEGQLGVEAELRWLKPSLGLAGQRTEDWLTKYGLQNAGSHQHPDHET